METTHAAAYQASPSSQPATGAEMSVKDWMITLLIMFIPLVNIIMLFVWAFGGDGRTPSKTNWAKASLLWMVIITGIYVLLALTILSSVLSSASM